MVSDGNYNLTYCIHCQVPPPHRPIQHEYYRFSHQSCTAEAIQKGNALPVTFANEFETFCKFISLLLVFCLIMQFNQQYGSSLKRLMWAAIL
jgi:hypothetical protein